ncbi:hypothetical protein DM01DRAFT_1343822 [Hesseltinella vesiculosa]|uniref:Uncharacterized protein n=1 Tax=Hesseltinella vesiculosa TaxID=101127 RepID=A0A1X2GQF7_9FUNG|nr:hypothetical protein DM01DRAFT_1343822 [Hesseltinella vesiculosa]
MLSLPAQREEQRKRDKGLFAPPETIQRQPINIDALRAYYGLKSEPDPHNPPAPPPPPAFVFAPVQREVSVFVPVQCNEPVSTPAQFNIPVFAAQGVAAPAGGVLFHPGQFKYLGFIITISYEHFHHQKAVDLRPPQRTRPTNTAERLTFVLSFGLNL